MNGRSNEKNRKVSKFFQSKIGHSEYSGAREAILNVLYGIMSYSVCLV